MKLTLGVGVGWGKGLPGAPQNHPGAGANMLVTFQKVTGDQMYRNHGLQDPMQAYLYA